MVNSRAKGSKAERMLAAQLGDWTGVKFARTPSSGGLHWGQSFTSGDIVCTTEGHYFPFSIECKNYKEINVTELICNRRTKQDQTIIKFFKQCIRDSKESKKLPLLFMRYSGLPKETWLVVFPKWYLGKILKDDKFKYPIASLSNVLSEEFVIMDSHNLWEYDYKSIKKAIKQEKTKNKELWEKTLGNTYQLI